MGEVYESFPYQKKAFNKTWRLASAALYLDPGLGKTKLAIDTVCKLHSKKVVQAVFMFAPSLIRDQWANKAIPEHHWPEYGHSIFNWQARSSYKTKLVFDALESEPADNHIFWFCLNKEAILNEKLAKQIRLFAQRVPSMMILDESTFIKNNNKTTNRFVALGKHFRAKRLLTGTPQTNGPLDQFKPYLFLHPDILGVTRKDDFILHYCRTKTEWGFRGQRGGTAQKQQVQTPTELNDAFYERVAPYTVRIQKQDVLPDLPKKLYQTVEVELTPEEQEAYETLSKKAVAEVSEKIAGQSGRVVALNHLSLMVRLQQILSGIVALEEAGHKTFVSSKLQALWDFLETRSGPTIVFAHYRTVLDRTAEHLTKQGRRVACLHGGTKKSEDIVRKYNAGELEFLLIHPKSGGKGLDLTSGNEIIFFQNSYSSEDRIQCEDRIHRVGQKADHCLYVDFIVKGSIDETISQALYCKLDAAAAVFSQLKKEFL